MDGGASYFIISRVARIERNKSFEVDHELGERIFVLHALFVGAKGRT